MTTVLETPLTLMALPLQAIARLLLMPAMLRLAPAVAVGGIDGAGVGV
jgi:hypothetical protein